LKKREQIKSDANSCGYERQTRVRLKYSPLNYENEELVIESIAFGHGLEIFSFYYTHVVRGFLYIFLVTLVTFFSNSSALNHRFNLALFCIRHECITKREINVVFLPFSRPKYRKTKWKYFSSVSVITKLNLAWFTQNRLFIL
jgi:hypothetical protein